MTLHPVKTETFDVQSSTNVDPKGFLRQVDTYKVTNFGLYMARGSDHQRFGYLESWLLPDLGLRANIFHYRDGVTEREDMYFDVAEIKEENGVWVTRDLYIDLVWNNGDAVEVVDIDELSSATSEGLISAEDAERAIESTLSAVEGITRHGDNPMKWLRSHGYDLEWAPSVTLVPAGQ